MYVPVPLPYLPGAQAEKGVPGRHRGRAGYRQLLPQERQRRPELHGAAGAESHPDHDRRPDRQGNQKPAGLSTLRGLAVPDPQPGGGDPVRRREPADPAGYPDRFLSHGGAVYPGRALHRSAPAGQRQAACHPEGAAGSGQHPAGGGARRGHHAGGGLYHRRGSRRRSSWRPDRGRRYPGGGHEHPRLYHRGLPVRPQKNPRSHPAPEREWEVFEDIWGQGEQPAGRGCGVSPGYLYLCYRGIRIGQILPGQRDPI